MEADQLWAKQLEIQGNLNTPRSIHSGQYIFNILSFNLECNIWTTYRSSAYSKAASFQTANWLANNQAAKFFLFGSLIDSPCISQISLKNGMILLHNSGRSRAKAMLAI